MAGVVVSVTACLPFSARAEAISVTTSPVTLHPENPDLRRIDRLEYRGGLVLTSPDKRFGGLSDLAISANGKNLTAISDRGHLFRARLVYDADGDLAGVREATLSRLTGLDGQPLSDKKYSDAEALIEFGDGSRVVAFEQRHRILAYGGRHTGDGQSGLRASLVLPPPELHLAPSNDGIEAMARLPDGRVLALTEKFQTNNGSIGWIGTGILDGNTVGTEGSGGAGRSGVKGHRGGTWQRLSYAYDGRFSPTGAAALANGDVLVIERAFSLLRGFSARLMRIHGADIKPGARLAPALLANLSAPYPTDNFEGVAVHRAPNNETRITLLSDDNFIVLQQTLLLMFALPSSR